MWSYIVGAMILGGFVLMLLSLVKYHRVQKSLSAKFSTALFSRPIMVAVYVFMCIFMVGFLTGAWHILFRDASFIFYFIGTMFAIAGLYSYVLIHHLYTLQKAYDSQQLELDSAIKTIAEQNESLQDEVVARIDELLSQQRLLRAVNEMAGILMDTDAENFNRQLWLGMKTIGQSVDVDRVYVWQNHRHGNRLYCTQLFEWSEGAEPQQDTDITIDISYDENMPTWEAILSKGRSVNGIVKNMLPEEQNQLSPQGIISILVVPVFKDGLFWGFIGFDDCRNERIFTEAEDSILRSASILLTSALLRNDIDKELMVTREQALASTRAKTDFLANMSHEIRTPINAVTGMAALAHQSEDLGQIKDYLAKIDTASRQLLGIINDVLDMSKIEAGKMQLAADPFDFRLAMDNVVSMMDLQAKTKNQTLAFDWDDALPRVLIGDDMRLSQIFINLLSNAVKFTPEGGHIALALRLVSDNGRRCIVEGRVTDTGIGMSDEQISRLFQTFEQAEQNTARKFGGTGLGLAISRNISLLMDGEITVESEENEGSCFVVSFTLPKGTPGMLTARKQRPERSEQSFAGRRVLLAEDVEVNREIVVALLSQWGIETECAVNGEEVYSMFNAEPERYDLIFMDVHMPRVDGYEATALIRCLPQPEARAIPIVAMTANAFTEDVERCLSVGMNDHIAKPLDVDRLYDVLDQYL